MKWMLIVVVFGIAPVKTNLLFDSIEDCLRAEDAMRAEYARTYDAWWDWAQKNPAEAHYPESQAFIGKRIGLQNLGTCIPHAELPAASN